MSVLCLGEVWLELNAATAPELTETFRAQTGGWGAGFCRQYAALGGQAALLAQLGADPFGRKLAARLARDGVDCSLLCFTDAFPTPVVFTGTDTALPYRAHTAGLALGPEQLEAAPFRGSSAFCFSSAWLVDSPLRLAHLEALAAARDAGALCCYLPRLAQAAPYWPQREALCQTALQFLDRADVLFLEESDLLLRPDLSTMTILPWRTAEGRVMQFFCDVEKPDGAAFSGNCRGFLRDVNRKFKKLGLTCNVGTECEFYLFEKDDRGHPTCIPIDFGGYFDVAPLDAGENLRRDICLTMEQMGMAPQHSHHESGNGQNEVCFRYTTALKSADNLNTLKITVKAIAARNGLFASFMPKPLANQPGSGLHFNFSLLRDGKNLFDGDFTPDSEAGHFVAGILAHARELTAFCNPVPNSYARLGANEAPLYVSWSRQNRSQLVRIPMVKGDNCRMELRSPDPACNPYLAIGLILAAGLDGIEQRMVLQPPVNRNLFDAAEAKGLGLETLPATLEEAVQVAEESEFLRRVLPEGLSKRYFSEELKRCAALRSAPDRAEHERVYYFNAI